MHTPVAKSNEGFFLSSPRRFGSPLYSLLRFFSPSNFVAPGECENCLSFFSQLRFFPHQAFFSTQTGVLYRFPCLFLPLLRPQFLSDPPKDFIRGYSAPAPSHNSPFSLSGFPFHIFLFFFLFSGCLPNTVKCFLVPFPSKDLLLHCRFFP